MADVHNAQQRSRNMAAIKGKNTGPEMFVRRMLHRLGFRYSLHKKGLPGRPDLVFAARRKIILVHGCYWHMHNCRWGRVIPATRTEFWQTKRACNVRRDLVNQESLINLGWDVLVVWECEIRNLDLGKRLVAFLKSRRIKPSHGTASEAGGRAEGPRARESSNRKSQPRTQIERG